MERQQLGCLDGGQVVVTSQCGKASESIVAVR